MCCAVQEIEIDADVAGILCNTRNSCTCCMGSGRVGAGEGRDCEKALSALGARPFFFFFFGESRQTNARARRETKKQQGSPLRGGEDSERGETKFSAGVTVTAPTTMHAEERQHECSQRRSEVRAGRLSSRFRLRAYRTVQTRPVSSRSVHHGIFPDVYFYTHPSAAARTAPNGVKKRASFCLVFS